MGQIQLNIFGSSDSHTESNTKQNSPSAWFFQTKLSYDQKLHKLSLLWRPKIIQIGNSITEDIWRAGKKYINKQEGIWNIHILDTTVFMLGKVNGGYGGKQLHISHLQREWITECLDWKSP